MDFTEKCRISLKSLFCLIYVIVVVIENKLEYDQLVKFIFYGIFMYV